MPYKLDRGWFTEVNGIPVRKRTPDIPSTTWAKGHPTGYIFHYTAGCGSDISGTYESRGAGANFSVDTEGHVYEYLPVRAAGWHAYEASRYFWGVEHTSDSPQGKCPFTDVQLEASAKLTAALLEFTKNEWGFAIPLVKLKPPVTLGDLGERFGFLDHTDGPNALEAGGADKTWNKKGHTDLLYRWSWDEYLDHVRAINEGEQQMLDEFILGMTEAEAKALKLDGSVVDPGPPPETKGSYYKAGWKQVRWNVNRLKGRDGAPGADGATGPTGPTGVVAPHSHSVTGTTDTV